MTEPATFNPLTCTPMSLPEDRLMEAAAAAHRENPVNHPPVGALLALNTDHPLPPMVRIAVVTTKYWRGGGHKRFTVGFLDNPPNALRAKILLHMNAWNATADVSFVETGDAAAMVRIARGGANGGGYWSYLGTDILLADKGAPTMNLEGFTMATTDAEFFRVVRHETGHTLGCPHEHMRAELVARIDPAKAIAYYSQSQNWSEEQVRAQVLTPLEQGSLWGTDRPDTSSIMCYQVPGALTTDGQPILGGADIDPSDYAFLAKVYPKPAPADVPDEPPPADASSATTTGDPAAETTATEIATDRTASDETEPTAGESAGDAAIRKPDSPAGSDVIEIERPDGLRVRFPAAVGQDRFDALLDRLLS